MKNSRVFVILAVGVSLAVALVAGAGPPSLDARVDAAVQRFTPHRHQGDARP
jgi:hypothetical protein